MEYNIVISGCEKPLKLNHNSFTGKLTLQYGTQYTTKKQLTLNIENDEGEVMHLRMKRQLGNMIPPKLFVDEKEIIYAEKLTFVDKLFLFIPIILPVLFALTGMVFAFITFYVNHNIIHSEKNKFVRGILCLMVTVVMVLLTMFVASYLVSLLES